MKKILADPLMINSMHGDDSTPDDGRTASARQVDSETLNRLRLMQMELVEATNTAQLLQQVKELKQERFQLFLELIAARQGIDLRREEIRLADGRVVPRGSS